MSNISIVVSSYKRESYLKNLILSVEKYFPDNSYEIIVVSSDDPNSNKILQLNKCKNVKVIHPDLRVNKRIHSLYYYENIGIKASAYEWIFVTNDDTKFVDNFYEEFLKVKDTYDVVLVGGHIGDRVSGIRIPTIGSITNPNKINDKLYLFDFTLIKKEVYEKIGYLDESVDWFGKGADLSLQVEFLTDSKILYQSNLNIDHEIADENRIPGDAQRDFSYIKKKWKIWCSKNIGYDFEWNW